MTNGVIRFDIDTQTIVNHSLLSAKYTITQKKLLTELIIRDLFVTLIPFCCFSPNNNFMPLSLFLSKATSL